MAVDACPDENDLDDLASGYSIRPAERPGPRKLDKTKAVMPLDSFGMKRKRTVGLGSATGPAVEYDENMLPSDKLNDDDMDMGDVGSLSLNSPERIGDQEMKSDDEDSSFDSEDEDEADPDDRGREGGIHRIVNSLSFTLVTIY